MNTYHEKLIKKQKANDGYNSLLTKVECEEQGCNEENKLEFFNVTSHRGYIKLYDVLVCYPTLSLTDRLIYCTCKDYTDSSHIKGFAPISLSVVANRLDISRTTVSRTFSKLQKLGIISLYENNKKQRFIKIEKDFEEMQPEEKEYWSSHEREFKKFIAINKLKETGKTFEDEEDYALELQNI